MKFWASVPEVQSILKDKRVFVSFYRCLRYTAGESAVVCELMPNLKCEGHEEADTKIIFFLSRLGENKEVLIKCSDTDILVILLGNMEKISKSLNIWVMFGIGNHRRYLNMWKIYNALGEKICRGLPALHALTGCDYNPAFYRKGKTKPWQLYCADESFQEAFFNLQNPRNENYEQALEIMEEFVCKLYCTAKNGLRGCKSVDEARLRVFSTTYGHNIEPNDEFRQKLRDFDACTLPPCKRELLQQLLRTSYISHLWKNSSEPIPNDDLVPDNFGWKMEENKYSFVWFTGDEVPPNVEDIIAGENFCTIFF